MSTPEPEKRIDEIIAETRAAKNPTAWFERLYAEAAVGRATVPWDRHAPHWLLARWACQRGLEGRGKHAVVIGCGTGDDAAYIASLGYRVTAFDISPSAIRTAHDRYPGSQVEFVVADLFALPTQWHQSFALAVESQTVQALPRTLRETATVAVANLVAPGGTLLVLASLGLETDPPRENPPWPLTRPEVERFAATGLHTVAIDEVPDPGQPSVRRWCAEFRRHVDSRD